MCGMRPFTLQFATLSLAGVLVTSGRAPCLCAQLHAMQLFCHPCLLQHHGSLIQRLLVTVSRWLMRHMRLLVRLL